MPLFKFFIKNNKVQWKVSFFTILLFDKVSEKKKIKENEKKDTFINIFNIFFHQRYNY